MQKKETVVEKATHQGELKIGDMRIPCAVTKNRDRLVSIRGMANALGVKGGGAYWKTRKENPDETSLPEFISAKNIEPFVQERIKELMDGTVPYIALSGKEAVGIKAEIIPKICDIWVKALSEDILTKNQRKVAEKSRILLGAFAQVGITALVDEATGFQKDKDEYQKILAKYIATELQPWLKIFGDDYYFQIYRLKGWDWNRFAIDRKNHPWAVANITNRIVYEKLPDGILEKLQELSPANSKGNRPNRLHQRLTPNEGQVHLLKHLGSIVTIMERYEDGEWEKAIHEIDTRFPSKRIGNQATLPFEYHTADKNLFDSAIKRASKSSVPEESKTQG